MLNNWFETLYLGLQSLASHLIINITIDVKALIIGTFVVCCIKFYTGKNLIEMFVKI